MTHTQNHLSEVKQNDLFNVSKFVVTENFKHHMNDWSGDNFKNDISSVYEEELNYFNSSQIFTVKNDTDAIIGTIRVLKWNFITPLPIQKIFGINPLFFTNGKAINKIFHIGRLAIRKEASDLKLLKKLMVLAIEPICKHKDNVAFAECDAKLFRVMRLMGIKATIIGKSIEYLGSETIPVCLPYDGLIDFYNKNKNLLEFKK